MLYVHVFNDPHYTDLALRFMGTYEACPPGYQHKSVVICNKGRASKGTFEFFNRLPNLQCFNHNNDGFDIGGYIAYARQTEDRALFCCGATTHFRKPGWLRRLMQVWDEFGPGMYGTLATYEVSPHFCTTGFLISPQILREYPFGVHTKEERYMFEHGPNSCVRMCIRSGIPAKLVTWDGVYDWPDWRKPANCYSRGDQSNCLTFFKHSDSFELSSEEEKVRRQSLADPCTVSAI